jgi:pimeloyl-ACP methyl ester carboxylesterase
MGTSDPTDVSRRRVLILVHGTFARQTEWVQETSFLAQYLINNASVSTDLCRFEWSGKNSHGDRLEAGKELCDYIKNIAAQNHGAEIFVIAHSHGGTVALYALKDREVAEKVKGLVTMGTPFLSIRCRNLATFARVNRLVVPLVTAAAWTAMLFISMIAISAGEELNDTYRLGIKTVAVSAFCFTLIAPFLILWLVVPRCTFLMKRLYLRTRRKQQDLWKLMRYNEDLKTPLLRISVRGDEAWMLLYCSWLAGVIPFTLWTATVILMTVAIPITIALYCGVIFLGDNYLYQISSLTAMLFALIALPVLALIFQAGMATIPRIVRYLAFGPETFAEAYLLFVEPDIDPTGISREVEHSKSIRRSLWAFNHCRIYLHEDVAKKIVQWLDNPICPRGPKQLGIVSHVMAIVSDIFLSVWKGLR